MVDVGLCYIDGMVKAVILRDLCASAYLRVAAIFSLLDGASVGTVRRALTDMRGVAAGAIPVKALKLAPLSCTSILARLDNYLTDIGRRVLAISNILNSSSFSSY